MSVNLINFNMSMGRSKPRTFAGMPNQSECPFCDVDGLENILATEGNMILLKNKYNVMEPANQMVLIETDQCHSDIPDYQPEHMHRLLRFALRHWLTLANSGEYQAVVLFKNFGDLSGGTIRHPHMQIIGFPEADPAIMCDPAEFEGLTVVQKDGVEVNIASQPHVGFTEINIRLLKEAYSDKVSFAEGFDQSPAPLPLVQSIYTMADYIQGSVAFLRDSHRRNTFSYNLFFYIYQGRIHVRLLPRYPTSPLFIGYNIHLSPNNKEQTVTQLAERLKKI